MVTRATAVNAEAVPAKAPGGIAPVVQVPGLTARAARVDRDAEMIFVARDVPAAMIAEAVAAGVISAVVPSSARSVHSFLFQKSMWLSWRNSKECSPSPSRSA